MIVEERIYTLKPDSIEKFLHLYKTEGLEVQLRHLPRMLGYFVTEIGTLHQVVHLWGYEDFEERERCRKALRADPSWQAYVPKVRPLFDKQENRILLPTSWSPIR
jgi:hypothetical protein